MIRLTPIALYLALFIGVALLTGCGNPYYSAMETSNAFIADMQTS